MYFIHEHPFIYWYQMHLSIAHWITLVVDNSNVYHATLQRMGFQLDGYRIVSIHCCVSVLCVSNLWLFSFYLNAYWNEQWLNECFRRLWLNFTTSTEKTSVSGIYGIKINVTFLFRINSYCMPVDIMCTILHILVWNIRTLT